MHLRVSDKDMGEKELRAVIENRRIHTMHVSFENHKLFHQDIKSRRLQNTVYSIHDMNAKWVENIHDVNAAFSRVIQTSFVY